MDGEDRDVRKGPERITLENVEDAMTYQRPDEDRAKCHDGVNAGAIQFARTILEVVPESPERTLSIRAVQEARFWANSAVAHKGRF